MTTSGTTVHNPVFNNIIYSALRKIGGYNTNGGAPRASQLIDAQSELNDMLKEWQGDGLTWLRQFIYVTLVAGHASYNIGPTSTDLIHSDAAGVTDYLQRPLKVNGATRYISSSSEIPLKPISRADYLRLTNKSAQGAVVQYYYDAQRDNGKLYVYLTPDTGVTDKLVLDVDRIIEDTGEDGSTLNLDIPPYWINAVKYNLAFRLSPEYGLSNADREILAQEATEYKEKALDNARENASTFFQPGQGWD